MRCELIETRHGWKLQRIGTGRFYGYVRADTPKKTAALLERIKAEIERQGYYEAYSGAREE